MILMIEMELAIQEKISRVRFPLLHYIILTDHVSQPIPMVCNV